MPHSSKTRERHAQEQRARLRKLAQRFPDCIILLEWRRRPLQIGIHDEMLRALDGEMTTKDLKRALAAYCGNETYLRRCVAGAQRIGIDGKPCGVVSEEEAARSAERLKTLKAARAQKAEAVKAQGKAEAVETQRTVEAERASAAPRMGLSQLKEAWRKRQGAAGA